MDQNNATVCPVCWQPIERSNLTFCPHCGVNMHQPGSNQGTHQTEGSTSANKGFLSVLLLLLKWLITIAEALVQVTIILGKWLHKQKLTLPIRGGVRISLLVMVLIVGGFACGIIGLISELSGEQAAPPPPLTQTIIPTETPRPTETPAPTETPRPTETPTLPPTETPAPPTATPGPPSLPVGTSVTLQAPDGDNTTVWYMYEDRCEIDVAHSFVPSGVEAVIASSKVCYDSFERAHFYKVEIPGVDYTESNWVSAENVVLSDTLEPTATPQSAEERLRTVVEAAIRRPSGDQPVIELEYNESTEEVVVKWWLRSRGPDWQISGWETVDSRDDAEEILIAIGHRSGIDYSAIRMVGMAKVIDNTGNLQTVEALKIGFSKQVLEDMNWEYFLPSYRLIKLHEFADYMQAHPDYQWWGDGATP